MCVQSVKSVKLLELSQDGVSSITVKNAGLWRKISSQKSKTQLKVENFQPFEYTDPHCKYDFKQPSIVRPRLSSAPSLHSKPLSQVKLHIQAWIRFRFGSDSPLEIAKQLRNHWFWKPKQRHFQFQKENVHIITKTYDYGRHSCFTWFFPCFYKITHAIIR